MLKPLDHLHSDKDGYEVRYNPNSDASSGGDPNIEVNMGVMGWVRPTAGSHPAGIKIADDVKREEVLKNIAANVRQMVAHWADKTVELAVLLCDAMDQFPKTSDGRKKWKHWLQNNIDLGETRVRELVKIGRSDDKAAAARDHRNKTAKRVDSHRKSERESALRNAVSVSSRERIFDWSTYCDDNSAAGAWELIESSYPEKPFHVARLEMHLYARQKRPLRIPDIAKAIGVNRGVAADLLEYAVQHGFVTRTKKGTFVRAGEPRKPLDLYQCLVKNGLWFTVAEVEEGFKTWDKSPKQIREMSIRKDGKLGRAFEVALENGYLNELADGSVVDDDIAEMLVWAFHGKPTFKPGEIVEQKIWEGFQAIRQIERHSGMKAAGIFECYADRPDKMWKSSIPDVDFDRLWDLLLRGVDINYAIQHMNMRSLVEIEWKPFDHWSFSTLKESASPSCQLDLFLPSPPADSSVKEWRDDGVVQNDDDPF